MPVSCLRKSSMIIGGLLAILILALTSTSIATGQSGPLQEPTHVPPEVPDTQSVNASLVIVAQHPQADTPGEVLDTFQVPVDGTTVSSNIELKRNKTYSIRVSGTYIWGECDPFYCPNGGPDYLRYGDAEYLTDDHWQTLVTSFWIDFVYLEMDGTNPYFGSYNPDHVYNLLVTGLGRSVDFHFHDCETCYVDNQGYVWVQIIGEQTESWWHGAWGTLKGAARRLGMTTVELYARLKNLGPAWESLTAAWQIKKAADLADDFETPEFRAQLIDEAYYGYDGKNTRFRSRVDSGVQLGCALIGCNANSWDELSYEHKLNDDLWLSVCASVGGGYCSGYLLPQFTQKWLEETH